MFRILVKNTQQILNAQHEKHLFCFQKMMFVCYILRILKAHQKSLKGGSSQLSQLDQARLCSREPTSPSSIKAEQWNCFIAWMWFVKDGKKIASLHEHRCQYLIEKKKEKSWSWSKKKKKKKSHKNVRALPSTNSIIFSRFFTLIPKLICFLSRFSFFFHSSLANSSSLSRAWFVTRHDDHFATVKVFNSPVMLANLLFRLIMAIAPLMMVTKTKFKTRART